MVTEHDEVIMQETAALLADLFPDDIPSIFIPYIVFLIDEKGYEKIDNSEITRDFYKEFGIELNDLLIERLCNEAINQEYIYEMGGRFTSNPMKIKTREFSKEFTAALNRYETLKKSYGKYVVEEKGLQPLSDEELDQTILKIIQNISVDAPPSPTEDDPLEAYGAALNDFMLYANKEYPEIVDVINQFAVSSAIWSVIANEQVVQPFFKNKPKIFLDTRCILRLIGLEGDYWKRVFQSFLESIRECGGEVIVFQHVMDEINSIITSARRAYSLPNFDIERSSPVARLFYFEKYNDAKIDLLLYNLNENPILNYNFSIESYEYDKLSQEHQIDYEGFKESLIRIYKDNNPEFDLQEKYLTVETDIRSITMTYRIRGNTHPYSIHDANAFFVTTNSGLFQATKLYDKRFEKNNSDIVPVCLTVNYLSTLIWLSKPTNYIKNNKQKLLAYCYAATRPTKEQIKAYFEQVDQLKQTKEYSSEQLRYIRESRTLMRTYTLISRSKSNGTTPTLLEALEIYKKQTSDNLKLLEDEVKTHKRNEEIRLHQRENIQKAAEKYADSKTKWLENNFIPFIPAAITFVIALITFLRTPEPHTANKYTFVSGFTTFIFVLLGIALKNDSFRKMIYDWLKNKYMKKHIDDIWKLSN